MSWVLLGNDDGVDSPALVPFADALEDALDLPVRVAVPDRERSWSGKAITRGGEVRSAWTRRGDRRVVAVEGTPADAIQLGLFGLFAEEFAGAPPTVVVTGVNIGFNAGTGFLASSGTVWAAAEAAYAGIPAIAVSTGTTGLAASYREWRRLALRGDAAAGEGWRRVSATAASTVRSIGDSDLLDHCDLVSVNLPWDHDVPAQRSVTSLSTLAYGPLFEPGDDHGIHRTRADLQLTVDGDGDGDGDVAALLAGVVSVTPVVLPRSAVVPDRTRAAVERSGGRDG